MSFQSIPVPGLSTETAYVQQGGLPNAARSRLEPADTLSSKVAAVAFATFLIVFAGSLISGLPLEICFTAALTCAITAAAIGLIARCIREDAGTPSVIYTSSTPSPYVYSGSYSSAPAVTVLYETAPPPPAVVYMGGSSYGNTPYYGADHSQRRTPANSVSSVQRVDARTGSGVAGSRAHSSSSSPPGGGWGFGRSFIGDQTTSGMSSSVRTARNSVSSTQRMDAQSGGGIPGYRRR